MNVKFWALVVLTQAFFLLQFVLLYNELVTKDLSFGWLYSAILIYLVVSILIGLDLRLAYLKKEIKRLEDG